MASSTSVKNRIKARTRKALTTTPAQNGKEAKALREKAPPRQKKEVQTAKVISIPPLMQREMTVTIVGDRPLLVNNKMSVAEGLAGQYDPVSGGKTGAVKAKARTPEEQYAGSFYTMPDSKYPAPDPRGRYGLPASGIFKCMCSAIRTTGITDNTTVGLMQKSFQVMEDLGGLCLITGKPTRDVRPVIINQKVPRMAYRARWDEWSIKLRIKFNPTVLSEEAIVNLLMHAGQYIGLCEMRKEKKQGQCGGFVVDLPKAKAKRK